MRRELVCTTNGHNKQYIITLSENEVGQYVLDSEYGPVGGYRHRGVLKTYDSIREADGAYRDKIDEKLRKGYRERLVQPTYSEPPTTRPSRDKAPTTSTIEFYDNAPRKISL